MKQQATSKTNFPFANQKDAIRHLMRISAPVQERASRRAGELIAEAEAIYARLQRETMSPERRMLLEVQAEALAVQAEQLNWHVSQNLAAMKAAMKRCGPTK